MRSSRCSAPAPCARRSVGPGRRTIAAWHHPSRIRVRRGHLRRTSSPTTRPPRSWRCCARHGSWISRQRRCSSCCWTRASIWRACRASIGCCASTARSANGAARRRIRPECDPSWSPADRWSSGRGTSRNSRVRLRGDYYDLYVVLDIFSRYVVVWCVAPCESGELAKELIADAVARVIGYRPASCASTPIGAAP